ncbi:MAG: hypothetical protein LOD87_07670 [Planifilum fulgidum]
MVTMAVGMAVMRSHHVLHDFVGPFDVVISFLEAGVHCTGRVVVTGVHHGWMMVAGKKSEHALFTPHVGFGRVNRTVH